MRHDFQRPLSAVRSDSLLGLQRTRHPRRTTRRFACTASALYELSTYLPQKGYKDLADRILVSLASPAYRAQTGTNSHFLLMHSVGSIPHGHEIDAPINYADYYYLEALLRKKKLENGSSKLF